MKKVVCTIILCILWMGFIYYNSSNNGQISNERSYYLLNNIRQEYNNIKVEKKSIVQNTKPVNENIIKGNQNQDLNKTLSQSSREETLNLIIRKNAHAFEYFVLAILVSGLLFSVRVNGRSAIIYIMFICLFYAVIDEFRQSFVPGRSSLVSDVLIDFSGSLIGIFMFYLFYYKIYKTKVK